MYKLKWMRLAPAMCGSLLTTSKSTHLKGILNLDCKYCFFHCHTDYQCQHVVDTPFHLQLLHLLMVFVQNSVGLSTGRHVWAYLFFISERFCLPVNYKKAHGENLVMKHRSATAGSTVRTVHAKNKLDHSVSQSENGRYARMANPGIQCSDYLRWGQSSERSAPHAFWITCMRVLSFPSCLMSSTVKPINKSKKP